MKGYQSSASKRGTAALCLVALVALVGALPAAGAPYNNPYAPSNSFSFGKVKLNKNNGTATLTVDVPGAGTLTLTGNGVVKQRPVGARLLRLDKHVAAAGKVKLKVKPKGKTKTKLNQTGKATVRVKVKFIPTGGTASTKHKKITLKKH